jgi:WS/DGAT/MGAT family acyltransferase
MAKTEFMAATDAVWMHMEHPTNLMYSAGILLFDAPLSEQGVEKLVAARLLPFNRFKQRVVRSRLSPSGFQWEPDPHFDISAHVHRFALPQPGDKAVLQELLGDMLSTPLDPAKPLWHIQLLDGYKGGTGMLVRIHHCIADGIALIYLMLSLLDNTPEMPELTPYSAPQQDEMGIFGRITTPANRFARRAQRITAQSAGTLTDARKMTKLAQLSAKSAITIGQMLTKGADSATFLKSDLGVAKHLAWSEPLPLATVKAIGKAHSATINDVVLTMFTGSLRDYLLSRGEPVDELTIRVVVPVALRPLEEATQLGNKFATVTLELPIAEADPWEQLRILKQRMDQIKQSPEALITFTASSVVGMTPSRLASRTIEWFQTNASMIVTNVPGPREQLYCLGQSVRGIMAWGPMGGRMGAGVTIVSYNGGVNLGVFADAAIVPDPERLLEGFDRQFDVMRSILD